MTVHSATCQIVLRSADGDSADDRFGQAIAIAADIDGDGIRDHIVGASGDDNNGNNSGSVRILSGRDGTTIRTLNGDAAGDEFGFSVASVGDLDSDGFDEIIVGAPGNDTAGSRAGLARVFAGADGSTMFSFFGDSFGDEFGTSVGGAGDVNGDGTLDFVVGARRDDNGNTLNCGSIRVLSGADGSTLRTLYGDAADDELGIAVAGAGDLNNDGFDDFVAGAWLDDDNGTDCGAVRAYSGSSGSVLYTAYGDAAGDQLGAAVAGAGDVDADGFADVVAGASLADAPGSVDAGLARVYSGATGAIAFTVRGASAGDRLGISVSNAGDVDQDDHSDPLIGAHQPGTGTGYARLLRGVDGSELWTARGITSGDEFGRAVADAGDTDRDGFIDLLVAAPANDRNGVDAGSITIFDAGIREIPRRFTDVGAGQNDSFGTAIGAAGDVNGDGFDDVIVGATQHAPVPQRGYARVVSGLDGSVLHSFRGDQVGDWFGVAVDGAGDVNGDGFADLVVGASQFSNPGTGYVRVFSGVDGSTLFTVPGDDPGDEFGSAVAGVGDVNGDGYDDIIVGAWRDDDAALDAGSACILSGVDGATILRFDGDSSIDFFGIAVAGAGDVNADGVPDVIIGAIADDSGGLDSGSAYVFSGADGSNLFTFGGGSSGDWLGSSVSAAGDVNDDGFDDIITGARRTDATGTDAGSARVYSGADGSVLYVFDGRGARDEFGWSVDGAGDVNGDGHDDFLVGAALGDANGTNSGSARVFSGADGSTLFEFEGDVASDWFGQALCFLGDVNGDGFEDLAIAAPNAAGTGEAYVFSPRIQGNPGCVRTRGAGCVGSMGRLPRIGYRGFAKLGQPFTITLRGGAPSSPLTALAFGGGRNIPLDAISLTGCTLYANPLVTILAGTDAMGMANTTVTLPDDAGLVGVMLFDFQWFVRDPNAPRGLPLALSNGLAIDVGF